MKTPPQEHPCLSCHKSKAEVTGLCRRCYGKFRYTRIRTSLGKAVDTDIPGVVVICERCDILMDRLSSSLDTISNRIMVMCPECGRTAYEDTNSHLRPKRL